ncbi:hypothetical protein AB1Y20_021773 [Prymnesium parvum]|uniref:EF-hand domain-containing protein n=1 Tax=Prymnesium parvum TaxID=97485 RepID=A0AB34JLK0_PRYPA
MTELIADEDEEVREVFALIDHERNGVISQAALAQALLGSALLEAEQAREAAACAAVERELLDVDTFRACLVDAVAKCSAKASASAGASGGFKPSVGAGLLGILEDLRKFYAQERADFRLANACKELYAGISLREEERRLRSIAQRQEAEQQGVQEAQMMQAMEFNSAWSQNMAEFERQAQEILEQAMRKQQQEFAEFQEKLQRKEPMSYKFSRDLLQMKASVDTLARQGRYDEAHKLKRKADQLEKWERMKLQNDHMTHIANKELQMRQQHHTQLEALRRRIQRGREEHKEHWLMGAQRLMQSHRNMMADLKSKQTLESLRADVAVKLDMSASRSSAAKERIKKNYSDKPRSPGKKRSP